VFSEQEFDSLIEFLYIKAVQGISRTAIAIGIHKLQAAPLAAEFFHLDALAHDAQVWAALVV
jgi:hypothetical protein